MDADAVGGSKYPVIGVVSNDASVNKLLSSGKQLKPNYEFR